MSRHLLVSSLAAAWLLLAASAPAQDEEQAPPPDEPASPAPEDPDPPSEPPSEPPDAEPEPEADIPETEVEPVRRTAPDDPPSAPGVDPRPAPPPPARPAAVPATRTAPAPVPSAPVPTPRPRRTPAQPAAPALAPVATPPSDLPAEPERPRSLYLRLGGYDALAGLTDDFLARMLGDARLRPYFVGHSVDSLGRIRQLIVEHLCSATGGPCRYVGRDMRTAHAGLGITAAQFHAAKLHLNASLGQIGIGEAEKLEVLALAESLEPDIVQPAAPTR